jgi:hypothetical protein
VAITARIQNAMAQAAAQGLSLFGWQLITYAPEQVSILNVPQVENNTQVQYVMNTLTGAWCQFTGWNANCFEVFNENLFFGGNNGTVNQAFVGSTDFIEPIQADMQCAYNYFDAPGRLKRMTMVQPFITAGATISPQISVDADFQIQTQTSPVQIINGGSLWDTALWDISLWFGSITQTTNWLSAEAIGHALAVHLTLNVVASNTSGWAFFDYSTFDEAEFDTGELTSDTTLQVNAFNSIIELGGFV